MERFDIITRGHKGSEFNIKCMSHNGFSGIGKSYNEVEVPGRDSPLIKDSYTRERFKLEVDVVVDSDNILRDAILIKRWLLGDIQDKPIELSNMEGYYFKGFLDNKLDISEVISQVGECTLKFNCQSYIRVKGGDLSVRMLNGAIITNNTGVESKPLIKITCTGDCKFMIGDSVVELRDVDGVTYIDSELMDTYTYNASKNIVLQNNKMYSDFPILIPGDNMYKVISGTIEKMEITPRWRVI